MEKLEALKGIVEILRPIMMSFYKKNGMIEYRGYHFDDDGRIFYDLDDECNAKEKFIKDFSDPVADMVEDGAFEVSTMDRILKEIMNLNLGYESFQSQKRHVLENPDYYYSWWHSDLGKLYHVFIDEEYAMKSLLKVSNIWLVPGIVKMVYAISRKCDFDADRSSINKAIHYSYAYLDEVYKEGET